MASDVEVDYVGRHGELLLTEMHRLNPNAVLTVNIRDKQLTPNAGSNVVGAVVISSDELINGDYFLVVPAQNFSFGDGLYGPGAFCLVDDVRYAFGGIFDDTIVSFSFFGIVQPGEELATVEVYDESGALHGFFTLVNPLSLPLVVDQLSVSAIADQLSGVFTVPTNGFLRFFWNENTVEGALTVGSIFADERFQVGYQAACRVPVS